MYMEKYLKNMGISKVGRYNDKNAYIIDIDNSDEYGKIYSILDKNDDLEEVDEDSKITIQTSTIVFESDEYKFTLLADFDRDTYKLICVEIQGEE